MKTDEAIADWPQTFDRIEQMAEGEVAEFAARELQDGLRKSSGQTVCIVTEHRPADGRNRAVVLQVDPELPASPAHGDTDRFRIRFKASAAAVFLEGVNARSLLFAVYTFLRDVLGWRFYHAGDAFVADGHRPPPACVLTYQSRLASLEYTYRDALGIEFLDGMTRNLFNGILVRLHDIQRNPAWYAGLLPAIARRGLNLTIGGHVIPQLLPAETVFDDHPEWFAEVDGTRRADSGHVCFSNATGCATFLDHAVAWIAQLKAQCPNLMRLTLWPEDSGYICSCERCRNETFVDQYAAWIGQVADRVAAAGLPVRVEYILYNADNAPGRKKRLDMMIPPVHPVAADTLVAYWGRTYAGDWQTSDSTVDAEALDLLRRASAQCQESRTDFRLYEYYIDHWMQSPLYAPLSKVIRSDFRLFRELNVRGMILDTSTFGFPKDNFPDVWLKEWNTFVIGDEAWDTPDDRSYPAYANDCYGRQAGMAAEILDVLSKVLPPVTQFNLRHPFPGLAGQLLWHRNLKIAWHTFDPSDRSAETLAIHAARKDVFTNAGNALCALILPESPETPEMLRLCDHVRFCRKRLQSICLQLQAQEAFMSDHPDAAQALIDEALQNDPFADAQRKEIEEWRHATQSHEPKRKTP